MMHPYRKRLETVSQLPAEGRDRQAILREMEELKELEAVALEGRLCLRFGLQRRRRARRLREQGLQHPVAIEPVASRLVAQRREVRGGDRGHDRPHARRRRNHAALRQRRGHLRIGHLRWLRKHSAGDEDPSRLLPANQRGITEPEIVLPISAHAAFHKAAQYFNLKLNVTPVDADFRADDVRPWPTRITPNTIALVASAVNFPYGTIDPIDEFGELAQKHDIGLHVDGCLGGFFLPWVEKLGRPVPPFDFRVPGVTSMSCDTHKYGYAPKGTSVVLYRGQELRRYQYFTVADWPGGLYYSPTFSGSRPGGLSAACWASLVSMGESGYLQATKRSSTPWPPSTKASKSIPELHMLGRPLGPFAFGSECSTSTR